MHDAEKGAPQLATIPARPWHGGFPHEAAQYARGSPRGHPRPDAAFRPAEPANTPWALPALIVSAACVWGAVAAAADWPQWQGPDRNAMSGERGLLQEWTPDGPPLAWKVDGLGGGHSTPSVADGRIFGMSHRVEDEVVWALSEKDGSPLWTTRLGPSFDQSWPQGKEGPGATPTVDGERLYVMGLAGNVACLRVEDGVVVWQRSLRDDFGAPLPTWSFRESPLVDGDKVVVTPGAEGATLVALDKLTGETLWKSAVPGNPQAAYSSAIAIDLDGQRQYVQFTAKAVVGVAAPDGALSLALRRARQQPRHQHLHAAPPRGPGLRRLGLRHRRRPGEAEPRRGRGCEGRRGLLHQQDAEPPRRHDPLRGHPLRCQRRQLRWLPRGPGLRDGGSPLGPARRRAPGAQGFRGLRRRPPLLPHRGRARCC